MTGPKDPLGSGGYCPKHGGWSGIQRCPGCVALDTPKDPQADIREALESIDFDWPVQLANSVLTIHFLPTHAIDKLLTVFQAHQQELLTELNSKVDRFEVIDDTGRAYVKGSIYGSPVKVDLSYQDDNRTLKVFVTSKIGELNG